MQTCEKIVIFCIFQTSTLLLGGGGGILDREPPTVLPKKIEWQINDNDNDNDNDYKK